MIVATAGHVDHGKSTLVRLMTGTDPDRWAEEKRRGLTIDLGFARMRRRGIDIDFVDVPGHQRYLSNMLAACGSIDITLLVVSAREGWRDQTEEHLQIIDLLGVRDGVVALTHADVVDDQHLEERTLEIVDRLSGTTLAQAPVVRTGCDSPGSIERLADVLVSLAGSIKDRSVLNYPGRVRLWIDRAFNVHGTGRVLTGTVGGGILRVGQMVTLHNHLEVGTAAIKSLHQFGEKVDEVDRGHRVGVTLSGTKRRPERGWALTGLGEWTGGQRWHVSLDTVRWLTPPAPARGGYKVFIGTTKVSAQLRYGRFSSSPIVTSDERRTATLARLHLAEAVGPVAVGDRFILRDDGTDQTIGGGTILAVDDERIHYEAHSLTERMAAIESSRPGDVSPIALTLVEQAGGAVSREELRRQVGPVPPASGVQGPWAGLRVVAGQVVAERLLQRRSVLLMEAIEGGRIPTPTDPLGIVAAATLIESRKAEAQGAFLTLPGINSREEQLNSALACAREAIGAAEHGFCTAEELLSVGIGSRVRKELVGVGELVSVGTFITTRTNFDDLTLRVHRALADGPRSVSELRTTLGLPRRIAVPLLETLDSLGLCIRTGNTRDWRGAEP